MTTPSNNDIFKAIAEVINCRDHKRGRKPALLLTIITREDGKTVVTDHNTGCYVAIRKRSSHAGSKVDAPKRKYTKRANKLEANENRDDVAEAVDLCNKLDKVEQRENDALGNAYKLLDMLKGQYIVTPTPQIAKKLASVEMIITSLGGQIQ